MHARWDFDFDFDVSGARTWRVSALKIEVQVHYFVTILEHKLKVSTQLLIKFIHNINKLFCLLLCDK